MPTARAQNKPDRRRRISPVWTGHLAPKRLLASALAPFVSFAGLAPTLPAETAFVVPLNAAVHVRRRTESAAGRRVSPGFRQFAKIMRRRMNAVALDVRHHHP